MSKTYTLTFPCLFADVIITGNVTAAPKKRMENEPTVDKYGISDRNVDDFTGFKVARKFMTDDGPKVFRGEVTRYTRFEAKEHLWHVKYEDSDSEELNYGELMALKDDCTSAPPPKKKSRKIALATMDEDDLPLLTVPRPSVVKPPATTPEANKRDILPMSHLKAAMDEVYGEEDVGQPPISIKRTNNSDVRSFKKETKRAVGAYGADEDDDIITTPAKAPTRGHNAPSVKLVSRHHLKNFYIGGFTGFLHEDASDVYKQPLSTSNVAIVYGVDTTTNMPAALISSGSNRAELSKRLLTAADAGLIVSLNVDRVKGRPRESLMRPVFADRDVYEFTTSSLITDIDANELGTVGVAIRTKFNSTRSTQRTANNVLACFNADPLRVCRFNEAGYVRGLRLRHEKVSSGRHIGGGGGVCWRELVSGRHYIQGAGIEEQGQLKDRIGLASGVGRHAGQRQPEGPPAQNQ